jgi:Helix-turn-helix
MSAVKDEPGGQLPLRPGSGRDGAGGQLAAVPGSGRDGAGGQLAAVPGSGQDGAGEELPLLPGFREMALRRMADDRRRLMTDLVAERQAARLSQTEVAARMGTSQSAVARLESGAADARASTLERYAAAVGRQITWRIHDSARSAPGEEATDHGSVKS